MKTSNIGTLDALTGSVKQPFMQSAAKSDSEPNPSDAADWLDVRYHPSVSAAQYSGTSAIVAVSA